MTNRLPIVTREVALPFVPRMSGTRVPIDNRLSTILSGVINEPSFINPLPTVQVPPEGGHFAIEEDYFFIFPILY